MQNQSYVCQNIRQCVEPIPPPVDGCKWVKVCTPYPSIEHITLPPLTRPRLPPEIIRRRTRPRDYPHPHPYPPYQIYPYGYPARGRGRGRGRHDHDDHDDYDHDHGDHDDYYGRRSQSPYPTTRRPYRPAPGPILGSVPVIRNSPPAYGGPVSTHGGGHGGYGGHGSAPPRYRSVDDYDDGYDSDDYY